MERRTQGRVIFLLVGCLAAMLLASWAPPFYGSSEGEILRGLRREVGLRMEDQIRLLEIRDEGEDRCVVFCGEHKRPDDRWIIRFRKNEAGNYEPYGIAKRMMQRREYYLQPLSGYSGDPEVCYAIWNESEQLAEARFRPNDGPTETVRIAPAPSLTIWRFQGGEDGWHLESHYYDSAGNQM